MVIVETPSEGKPSMGKSIRNFASVTRVGLDLAKRVFQVHAVDANGEIVVVRKLGRAQLIPFFAALPPCVVAMEACASAHHWGRALIELGHEVRLLPPAHVKPYVRRNKSDQVDAAAIYEAISRPGQRFVPVRSIENQAALMRHRARELLAGQRTAALNALRGHLAEIGVVAPQGAQHAYGLKRMAADGFNENGEIVVPDCVRVALGPLIGQIDALDEAIGAIDSELAASVKADETAKRLMTIPGVGPVTASAIVATIQDAGEFASGREFAAFLGLTPRQNSTGGKTRLGRITKMGDRYHGAYYVSPCCGTVIEHHQKLELVRKGRWIAGATRPGAFPSYHFDALSSPFVPWDDIAEKFVAAGDDQQKAKAFFNLTLGRPYEIKGDAPDHVRLMERREGGLTNGHIPPDGVMLVAAADVQMRGIWVEVIAYAPNRESWVVDALYLDGSTEAPDGEAFQQLVGVLQRQYPDAFGGVRMLDALGVDSGYRAHVVYAWTRAHQRIHPDTGRESVLALKGMDGWGKPAIGLPSLVDIDLDGRKVHKGARVWPVGTWPLKAAFYADVKKDGIKSGADVDPDGYCHFPTWLDENYFKQITSEWLTDEKIRGKISRVWKLAFKRARQPFLRLPRLQHGARGASRAVSTDRR